MDITNNWTIVVGIGAILSLVLYWSQEAYLKPIFNEEEKIKEKVRSDISKKLEVANDYVEKGEEERFVREIYDIIELKKDLRDLKEIFRGKMVPSSVAVAILTILMVTLWGLNNIFVDTILLYPLILLVTGLAVSFLKLRKYERRLSRYLEGEDPTVIFTD